MFLFQVFVNSAMTMGIAPITGIPLPFVSVGGSSMITNFLAIGILQAIYMRRVRRRRGERVKKLSSARGVRRSSASCDAARATRVRWRSPARASSCRCSRASCVRAASPPRSSRTASRALPSSSGSARPTRTRLRAASRAGVPIVAVTDEASVPYVLAGRRRPRAARPGLPGRRDRRGDRSQARRGRHVARGAAAGAAAGGVQGADRAVRRSGTRSSPPRSSSRASTCRC